MVYFQCQRNVSWTCLLQSNSNRNGILDCLCGPGAGCGKVRVGRIADQAYTAAVRNPFRDRVAPEELKVSQDLGGYVLNNVRKSIIPAFHACQHVIKISFEVPVLFDV